MSDATIITLNARLRMDMPALQIEWRFFLHFNSKEELLVAGLEERFDELVAAMNQVAATDPVW